MPTFLVKHPERGDIRFTLSGDRVSVGRRADNMVQINHATISGHHAELVAMNGHYVLRDLDSTNHCFIDGFQVSEADLNDHCRILIGSVECEYIPDAPALPTLNGASPANAADPLRKMVGALRAQNDELIHKLNEQQKQIDILGSARLLTPATGADLNALREKVRLLTEERDKLHKENRLLAAEVDRLRSFAVRSADARSQTVPLPDADEAAETTPLSPETPVALSASGVVSVAAPMARVATPQNALFTELSALRSRFTPLLVHLASEPGDRKTKEDLAAVSAQLIERAASLGAHAATRLAGSLDALVRDATQRPAPVSPRVRTTIEQATDLFERLLSPELMPRSAGLPEPGVLVVEDDAELLPAIQTSLEFARLNAAGAANAEQALAHIQGNKVDLVLLDIGLPGLNGLDVCSHIRSLPDHERTPIVFLTGHDSPQERGQGALNGGSDFIAKPFNMFELTLKAHTWAIKNQLGLA